MAASGVRGAMALRTNIGRPVAFVRKIPWTAGPRACDDNGGNGDEEELRNALQQENHVIDGVKLHVQAQKPKALQGDQTSDEEKDF
ncbi:SRA stem-loop-interacting RNA-binding protein; mitochondrial [Camelus dromedarius]|uniref:SRA stem-loop-interacting RNA-binding protein n=1 Tax=Camelus dromedarius TaxID=9838 RepID=A0A5N4E4J8_CAMDR|nr:SRA stem-loop-interacting RNA-binding protein; mitochondrial [Camelus dromedarius]